MDKKSVTDSTNRLQRCIGMENIRPGITIRRQFPGVSMNPIQKKSPPATTDEILVTHLGPEQPRRIYLFADVLEELIYHASQRKAHGMLTGHRYLPQDTPEPGSEVFPYIEITAFKEIYPAEDAIEYAHHLRKMRDFRDADDGEIILGTVSMAAEMPELMLEDLLVQRTYFADADQVLLFVSADKKPPKVFRLDPDTDMLTEAGLEIVGLKESPLPFDFS